MSIRTIIEINHDYFPESKQALSDLVEILSYASEGEVAEKLRATNALRFITRRHHSQEIRIEVD